MKKISLILLIFSLARVISAQFYLTLNAGYSVSTHPFVYENRVIADDIIDHFRVKFSHGQGLNINFGIGYGFSANFFGEINVAAAFFSRSRSDNDWGYYFRREYLKLHLSGLNGDAIMKNHSLQVFPMAGLSAGKGKFRPFIKAGPTIVWLKGDYTNSYTYKYFSEGQEPYLEFTELEREYTGKIKVGFRGSAGVLYKLTDHLTLLADVTAVNSMYHFDKSHTLSFKVDGVEKVGEIEDNPKTLDDTEGIVDFSNIGLNVGIRYNF